MTTVVGGSADANAMTDSRTVCDTAGNCTTAGPIAGNKIDRLSPEITLTAPVNGAVYAVHQAVTASFSCTDIGAGIASCAATVASGAAIDTTTVGPKSFTVTATDGAGNSVTTTVTYDVTDTVAPVITCDVADGHWHAANVSLACTAVDAGSGLANPADASFVLSTSVADGAEDGNATTDSRTVCDNANNCVTAGPIVGNRIDRKNPEITLTTPVNGATYAIHQAIAAGFSCVDTGSGVSTCDGTVANGASIDTVTTGTKSFTVSATDAAGNTASTTVTYQVTDGVAPVIACGTADGAWHNANVTLTCTASDAGTGLANPADASFVLTTSVAAGDESPNASTNSRVVCDVAGNCATAGPIAGNKIDLKAPTITLTSPANGVNYQLGRTVAAAYACADTGAGIATCSGTAASGAPINTATTGTQTFTVTATDAAGNTTATTVTYTVVRNTIRITNIPASAVAGGSFTAAYEYFGDGNPSVTSLTPVTCSASGDIVTFKHAGLCILVPHAPATANFTATVGLPQSFTIKKRTPTIAIANLPATGRVGGEFEPRFAYDGNGETKVHSETPKVCKASDDEVEFVAAGTCTLVAEASASRDDERVVGAPQSITVTGTTRREKDKD